MPQTQIAFDFGEVQEKPVVEKKPVAVKRQVPAITKPAEPPQKSTRGRKSLKEMSAGVDQVDVPEDAVLYQKMYYTIGKVAEMFKVNQSLIRLWENEFDVLKPKKKWEGGSAFSPRRYQEYPAHLSPDEGKKIYNAGSERIYKE